MQPTVSVIIPTHNRPVLVARAVQSARARALVAAELMARRLVRERQSHL